MTTEARGLTPDAIAGRVYRLIGRELLTGIADAITAERKEADALRAEVERVTGAWEAAKRLWATERAEADKLHAEVERLGLELLRQEQRGNTLESGLFAERAAHAAEVARLIEERANDATEAAQAIAAAVAEQRAAHAEAIRVARAEGWRACQRAAQETLLVAGRNGGTEETIRQALVAVTIIRALATPAGIADVGARPGAEAEEALREADRNDWRHAPKCPRATRGPGFDLVTTVRDPCNCWRATIRKAIFIGPAAGPTGAPRSTPEEYAAAWLPLLVNEMDAAKVRDYLTDAFRAVLRDYGHVGGPTGARPGAGRGGIARSFVRRARASGRPTIAGGPCEKHASEGPSATPAGETQS